MPKQQTVVTLINLKDGAAAELFQAELGRVLENIADRNTDWKTGRRITLQFDFKTNEDREVADVALKAFAKLAGLKSVETIVYLGKQDGEYVAAENNPKQSGLFDEQPRA